MPLTRLLADAFADLVLGGRCSGCGRPGRAVCPDCGAVLRGPAHVCWPDPTPAGLPLPMCVARYDGVVRGVLLAHKEQGRYGLARPLGSALGTAV
ncbi:MAG: ComF family protein, partial [Actinomycetota bacterium]|nr:ComF family protein [Actinomycetota bacterium]